MSNETKDHGNLRPDTRDGLRRRRCSRHLSRHGFGHDARCGHRGNDVKGGWGGDAFQCTLSNSELPKLRDLPATANSNDFVTESHSADSGWVDASGSAKNGEESVGVAQSAEVALDDSGSAHGALLASQPVRTGALDECAAVREDFAHS